MSSTTTFLNSELYEYLQKISLRENNILRALRQETAKLPGAQMQIAPEQGQFMTMLVRLMRAKRTIEIGVFTGYSALCVALALPSDGYLLACDINEDTAKVARRYWQQAGVAKKIDLRIAPAQTVLQAVIDTGQAETFDFAFIDADKTNYDIYYEKCLTLLRPGGVIMIDNVLWHGAVADKNNHEGSTIAIRQLNDKLRLDHRVAISLLPIGDGVMLAMKESSFPGRQSLSLK